MSDAYRNINVNFDSFIVLHKQSFDQVMDSWIKPDMLLAWINLNHSMNK